MSHFPFLARRPHIFSIQRLPDNVIQIAHLLGYLGCNLTKRSNHHAYLFPRQKLNHAVFQRVRGIHPLRLIADKVQSDRCSGSRNICTEKRVAVVISGGDMNNQVELLPSVHQMAWLDNDLRFFFEESI